MSQLHFRNFNLLEPDHGELRPGHELIVEGLVSIAHGENPRNIERKLAAYHPG